MAQGYDGGMSGSPDTETQTAPQRAVGVAIQNLTAARLGRGFVPLGVLFLWGVAGLVGGGAGPEAWTFVFGAVGAGGAGLAYGLRNVQLTFGNPRRPWMAVARVGGVIPPALGLYLFAWTGLRVVAMWTSAGAGMGGVASSLLGMWVLRNWWKLLEIESLAQHMTRDLELVGGGR